MKQTTKAVTPNIALQSWLRPALTVVGANKDYAEFRQMLESVDSLLRGSHLEAMAMDFAKGGAMNSSVQGMMRAAMIAETVSAADSIDKKAASSV